MSFTSPLAQVLQHVIRDRHLPRNQFTIVISPPGAGKTTLVTRVAATASSSGLRVAMSCPRVEQTLDLVRRLLVATPDQGIRLWLGQGRALPPDLIRQALPAGPGCVVFAGRHGSLIEIATVAKFAYLPELRVDLLIVDEAYQVSLAQLVPLLGLADRYLLVGDPGQLPPLVRINIDPFAAGHFRIYDAAPREVLRHVPASPVVKLRRSHRLPPDSATLVSVVFYPQLPFRSAVPARQRRVVHDPAGVHGDGVDRALDLLAGGASMVPLVLPPRTGAQPEVDEEVIALMAEVVERLLTRQLAPVSGPPFLPREIGCIHPRVAAGDALRRHLQVRQIPVARMLLATPEVAQGQQRPVMVVAYPISSSHPSDFDLDPGRLCVSLTRHLYGCLVVARDGFEDALTGYLHDSGSRAQGSPDRVWQGLQVHGNLWQELHRRGRMVQM